jgi:hypothetical protein
MPARFDRLPLDALVSVCAHLRCLDLGRLEGACHATRNASAAEAQRRCALDVRAHDVPDALIAQRAPERVRRAADADRWQRCDAQLAHLRVASCATSDPSAVTLHAAWFLSDPSVDPVQIWVQRGVLVSAMDAVYARSPRLTRNAVVCLLCGVLERIDALDALDALRAERIHRRFDLHSESNSGRDVLHAVARDPLALQGFRGVRACFNGPLVRAWVAHACALVDEETVQDATHVLASARHVASLYGASRTPLPPGAIGLAEGVEQIARACDHVKRQHAAQSTRAQPH